PLLFLCDTPGFMVGPQAERTATVRHFSRMFVTGANLSVPTGTVVLRKGYGLGAQAMAGGSFKAPLFTVGWPTSEFGAMGLEGAVRLGMRRELEAIEDPAERERAFEAMVATAYERGRGISMASYFEIDDVIDPADTRRWIGTLFDQTTPRWFETPGKRRPNVDTW
ncbi:MAG: carboxyl transferase domain-containing protein, partial [Solirubrobacteraceae bacterium]